MSYVDDVGVVREYISKRLRELNLAGLPADKATLATIRATLRNALEHLLDTDAVRSRWGVEVEFDPATNGLTVTVTALPPWRDWTLLPHQRWRTLCLEPAPADDAEHTATRVTILGVTMREGRRNIRYSYTDYALLGGEPTEFAGRDNDWEDDFRKKFPIPE